MRSAGTVAAARRTPRQPECQSADALSEVRRQEEADTTQQQTTSHPHSTMGSCLSKNDVEEDGMVRLLVATVWVGSCSFVFVRRAWQRKDAAAALPRAAASWPPSPTGATCGEFERIITVAIAFVCACQLSVTTCADFRPNLFVSWSPIITSSTSPITNTTQSLSLISIRKTMMVGNQKLPAVVQWMEVVMENNASCGWKLESTM